MTNKRYPLLIAAILFIIATEFSITAARPQLNAKPAQNPLIRIRRITQKQYESIMKLTDGKPYISEARLIESGHRSIATIGNRVTDEISRGLQLVRNITGLFFNTTSSGGNTAPMCVINISGAGTGTAEPTEAPEAGERKNSRANENPYGAGYPPYMMYPYMPGGDGEETTDEGTTDEGTTDEGTTGEGTTAEAGANVTCIVVIQNPVEDTAAGETDVEVPAEEDNGMNHHYGQHWGYPTYGYGYGYGSPHGQPHYGYRYLYPPQATRTAALKAAPKQVRPISSIAQPYSIAAFPARKTAVVPKRKKLKASKKRINRPAIHEMTHDLRTSTNVPKETTRNAYPQFYQAVYPGYGDGLPQPQFQAAFGGYPQVQAQVVNAYNPYAGYQPYAASLSNAASISNAANLRFPAQFQPQAQFPYGGLNNFAIHNGFAENSSDEDSGEYSAEEENDKSRAVKT